MNKSIIKDASVFIQDIRDYYEKDGNAAGGNLHIVLDDGNLDDGSILFCINNCIERNDVDGLRLCKILFACSMTQRGKLYHWDRVVWDQEIKEINGAIINGEILEIK